jgi:hypothetical protein
MEFSLARFAFGNGEPDENIVRGVYGRKASQDFFQALNIAYEYSLSFNTTD